MALINAKIDVLHPGNTNQVTAGALPTFSKPQSPTRRDKKSTIHGQLYRRLVIEYAGFCPVTLVKTGLLVPGNWNHGVLRYKNKLYTFDTPAKAKEWARDPDTFVDTIVQRIGKDHPDLVQLLHLYQYMPIVDNVENVRTHFQSAVLEFPHSLP